MVKDAEMFIYADTSPRTSSHSISVLLCVSPLRMIPVEAKIRTNGTSVVFTLCDELGLRYFNLHSVFVASEKRSVDGRRRSCLIHTG